MILFSLAGLVVSFMILALAPNLWWVAVARIVGGIMGASITASAYIADISPPEKRAQSFGLIGVAFGIGFVAGPLIGGLLGEIGSRLPFCGGGGLVRWSNCLFAYLLPAEIAGAGEPQAFSPQRRRNPIEHLHRACGAYPAVVFAVAGRFRSRQFGERRAGEHLGAVFRATGSRWGPRRGRCFARRLRRADRAGAGRARAHRACRGSASGARFAFGSLSAPSRFFISPSPRRAWMVYAINGLLHVGWACRARRSRRWSRARCQRTSRGCCRARIISIGTVTGGSSPRQSAAGAVRLVSSARHAPFDLSRRRRSRLERVLFVVALVVHRRTPRMRLSARAVAITPAEDK